MNRLRGCRVYHFHDTSGGAPVKQFSDSGDNLQLRSDAGNLAPFLAGLQAAHPTDYERVVSAIRQVAPFFRDFVLREEPAGLRLRWRQVGLDRVFSADAMSDGTLRFGCLATLLLQPEPPGLIVLDEPELGLHPFAIFQLANILRSASRISQVLIATQSVTLINQFDVSELVVVERDEGASTFRRPDIQRLAEWLTEYALGELWEKNLLGGRPAHESIRRDS
jgi:predicted ATPase